MIVPYFLGECTFWVIVPYFLGECTSSMSLPYVLGKCTKFWVSVRQVFGACVNGPCILDVCTFYIGQLYVSSCEIWHLSEKCHFLSCV